MKNILPEHTLHWERFKTTIHNQRFAQTSLFVGPEGCQIEHFIRNVIGFQLCKSINSDSSCNICHDCLMFNQNQHPDVQWIIAEKPRTSIKIDTIRNLQADIYQKPQRAKARFIIFQSAEYLSRASANALLKILEEPPEHIYFLLIAEQLSTLPATILSRCQVWRFNTSHDQNDLLQQTFNSDKESARSLIYQDLSKILGILLALYKKEIIPSLIALQWKEYELSDLLWLLYLIFAQLLLTLLDGKVSKYPQIEALKKYTHPQKIMLQIDKITALQRKMRHTNINVILAIEELFMEKGV